MRKPQVILIILISLILIQSFSVASATLTSDWTTFRHDPSRSGYTTGNGTTNAVKPLWNFSTSAAVWSSPAVSGDRVVVGSKDANIYCLNASNGELLWNFRTVNEVNSSPAIYGDLAYVGSDDGWLYSLNISSGVPVWISFVGGLVRSSPVIVDDRLYIGSGKHDLLCFNASDGELLWNFPTRDRIHSSPAVVDGVVYFAVDDFFVYAVNASTGKEIWHQHTGSNINSPSVSNGYVYVGSYDGKVFALNASTGAKIWKYQTQNTVVSSVAVAYGYAYVGSEDGSVYAFNATSGEKVWQTQTGYWVWSSPAVADGNLYVGSEDFNIYCLDAFTGAKKWAYPTGSYVDSSPAIVNNTLYVGSHDLHLYAFTLYNSTAQANSAESMGSLPITTLVFDFIAFSTLALVVYLIVNTIHTNRNKKPITKEMAHTAENPSWFTKHTNLLCSIAILVFTTAFFLSLTEPPLWAADEQTYSQMAYHMVKTGDYLSPSAFGEPAIWAGKPPLLMWLMSLSYQVLGVNNVAARIWAPLFGVSSLIVVFFLAKKLYNPQVGVLSVVVLGTFATFFAFATRAMTDGPLVFLILASIYFFVFSDEAKKPKWHVALSGVFFGLALLTKQIEALLIPLIIVVYFVSTKKSVRFLFSKRFGLFLGIAGLLFVPWLIYMALSFKEFWDCYFIYSDVTRVMSPIEGHTGDVLFYFNYLLFNDNFVWVILAPIALTLCAFNALVKRFKADALILVWIAVVLGVFTVAQTKLYWYILPALPAFAIAISNLLYQTSLKIQDYRLRKNSGNNLQA